MDNDLLGMFRSCDLGPQKLSPRRFPRFQFPGRRTLKKLAQDLQGINKARRGFLEATVLKSTSFSAQETRVGPTSLVSRYLR